MAPPTVANGKVYLASFGTKNIGTGQMCVYGLLPDGPPPDAPSKVRASISHQFVSLTWSPVPGARTYTLESTQGGTLHIVASGLTLPSFTDPAADKGTTEYTVVAVNANGQSAPSTPATVTITQTLVSRMPMPK